MFLEQAIEEDMMDGTTAAVLLAVALKLLIALLQVAIIADGELVAGNVGDSELVLCRGQAAVPLCQVR